MFPSSQTDNKDANASLGGSEWTACVDANDRLQHSKLLWSRGSYGEAIAELGEAIRDNPVDAEAYCLRGEVLASAGDVGQALADFSEAIRLDFHRVLSCASRVLLQTSQQQFDTAAAVARETLHFHQRLARAYFLRGRAFVEQGEVGHAVADFTQAIELQPDNSAALVHRGDAYAANGELARALADYGAALQIEPDNAPIWSKRGRAFHKQGEYDRAIADFSEHLQRDSACAAVFADRGTAYLAQGDHGRALDDLNRAIHLDPRSPRCYVQRSMVHAARCDYEHALADFGKALALDPANYFSHENQDIARRLKEKHDQSVAELERVRSAFQQALTHFAQAMDLEPRQRSGPELLSWTAPTNSEDGHEAPPESESEAPTEETSSEQAQELCRQGHALQANGDDEEALQQYTMALQLDPACVTAYLERGRLYRAQGSFDQAIADFSAALEIEDGSAEAYLRRGNAFAGKGDYQAAIADYDTALSLAPRLAGAYVNRALAFAKLGRLEQVIEDADRALAINPRLSSALFLRGAAYFKLDRAELAIADFDLLLLLEPRHPLAFNERGLAHASRGEYAPAVADYTRALELEPTFELAFFNRAIAYRLAGSLDRAIAELDELIARTPAYAPAYYQRGLAYLDKKEYDLAIANLTRAFQIDPQYKQAYLQCTDALRAKYQSRQPGTVEPDQEEATLPAPADASAEQAEAPSSEAAGPPAQEQAEAPPSAGPLAETAPTLPEMKAPRTLVNVGKLRLECPSCGTMGLLDVRNLQKAFRCPVCARWWRTDANGQLTPVTPVEGSGVEVEVWSNTNGRSKHRIPGEEPAAAAVKPPVPEKRGPHRKPSPATRPQPRSEGLLRNAGSLIAAAAGTRAGRWALAGLALLILTSVGLAITPLLWPGQLKTRGKAVTQAWLARDLSAMERYTDPAAKPFLEAWLESHPPPDVLGQEPAPVVRISVDRNDGRRADVVVQISAKDKKGQPAHYVFHQRWIEQGGDWYFHPPETKKPLGASVPNASRQGRTRR